MYRHDGRDEMGPIGLGVEAQEQLAGGVDVT